LDSKPRAEKDKDYLKIAEYCPRITRHWRRKSTKEVTERGEKSG